MDEKGDNTIPFHIIILELKIFKVFHVLFTLSLLDKRKVGGDSRYLHILDKTKKVSSLTVLHLQICRFLNSAAGVTGYGIEGN